ncbi:Hsp70 family protein [Candidatus Cyanaurora vandensis]|uniref:Hsp70 family protein n=1 Tax=Candidatus Cyanaurora vandensis TaxID=2714958 RepID=UPI00257F812A|nr:Hsp70 family protein [Candidatus Cyanaurora vandensis]
MYAIDFGTSNTVVSRWNSITRQAQTVALGRLSYQDPPNPSLIPSLVYVQGLGQIQCGQEVRDQGLDLPGDPRYFSGFKRGIGAKVQGFLPQVDGVGLTFEQVGAWFLGRLFQQLQAQGETPQQVVLTVPVNSFESYRQWLGTQVAGWQCDRVQLLDEPTAAALGYQAQDSQMVLVFDFGGGTLDLALIEPGKPEGFFLKWALKRRDQRPRTARVLAKAGRTLGGSDIDVWLAQALAEQWRIPRSYRLQRVAERIKIALSTADSHEEAYLDEENFTTYELSVTRAQLQELLTARGFFTQLDSCLTELLQQARCTRKDISKVLVVGGTSQIPSVQNWLRQSFQPDQLCLDKPFEAVAHGALQLVQGVAVQDYLYHSYGIRYWDHRQSRHSWQPLVKQGTPYPCVPVELVLGASVSNQPSIELVIGELAEQGADTEVYFDGSRLVTRQGSGLNVQVRPLNDTDRGRTIVLDPPGFPGLDRVRVSFWVDDQRTLRVTVLDLQTNRPLAQDQAVIELQ